MATIFRPALIQRIVGASPWTAIQAQAWVTADGLPLAGSQPFPPFVQSDWPNPRGYAYPVSLRTWAEPTKLNLRGQDTFFGGPGAGPDYDWPNPLRAGRLVPDVGSTSLALANSRAPFFQTDWQLPRGYAYPTALRTHLDPLKLNLLGQDTFFGGPGVGPDYDWPNPIRAGRLLPPVGSTSLALVYTQPFAQADWPNPRGYAYATSLRTFTDPLKLNLAGQDAFFSGAGAGPDYDWPNPRRAIRLVPDVGAQSLALALTVIAMPFTQGDWPNPRGYFRPQHALYGASPLLCTPWPYIATTTTATSGAASVTVSTPTGTSAGDLLVGLYFTTGASAGRAPSVPAGWAVLQFATENADPSAAAIELGYVAFRVATASEPGSYAFSATGTAGTSTNGSIVRILGADLAYPIDASGQQTTVTGSNAINFPSLTAIVINELLLSLGVYGDSALAASTDFPQQAASAEAVNVSVLDAHAGDPPALKVNLGIHSKGLTASGASGAVTGTVPASPTAKTLGFSVLVRAPFRNPFVPPDLPNPRGYVPAIALRTHLDPLKVNLLGKDVFFRGAGQPPAYDWPNPVVGHRRTRLLQPAGEMGSIRLLTGGTAYSPLAASIVISGATPALTSAGRVSPAAAQIVLTGGAPVLSQATRFTPVSASIVISGGTPLLSGAWFALPPSSASWTTQSPVTDAWTVIPPTTTTWH